MTYSKMREHYGDKARGIKSKELDCYEIDSLEPNELIGHAIGQASLEIGEYVSGTHMTYDEETTDLVAVSIPQEWDKLRISYDLLAQTAGVSAKFAFDILRSGYSADGETAARVIQDKAYDFIHVPAISLYPYVLAKRYLSLFTSGENGFPQLSLDTISKLSSIEISQLQAVLDETDTLSLDEAYRVCVALLIVDRELNYQRRAQ